jgi:hypothetical protein
MTVTRVRTTRRTLVQDADARLQELLKLHLHPRHGSIYWLRRQAALGWDISDRVRGLADLAELDITHTDKFRGVPVRDFIPRAFHTQLDRFITGETAGTSGQPCVTAYRDDEFEAAFIAPFLKVVGVSGFPQGVPWLWVGPSGPHIIGKVVRELARRTGSIDPFSVDFDPRWAKKLVEGSMARQRYLEHITEQAIDVIQREEIGVVFTTPPALTALATRMTDRQRESIRGVHYGGLSIAPETVNVFRAAFPNAVHLAGYGNTLFGVVMEVIDEPRVAMDYFPLGDRLRVEVVQKSGDEPQEVTTRGECGRVMFHRLDESALLVNVLERDEAERIPPSPAALALGATTDGLRNPQPPATLKSTLRNCLY